MKRCYCVDSDSPLFINQTAARTYLRRQRVDFNGALIELIDAADSIRQTNNNLFFFNNTGSWTNAGVFLAANSQTIFNGSTRLLGTGSYHFDDILINSNKALDHFSPYELHVKGDFINHGNFISNANKVSFSGTGPQVIDGSSLSSFYYLNIINSSPSGVSVNRSIWVTGL